MVPRLRLAPLVPPAAGDVGCRAGGQGRLLCGKFNAASCVALKSAVS
jgi:hypothetical protein